MNKLAFAALLALCLALAAAQDRCKEDGYYDNPYGYPASTDSSDDNPVKCYACLGIYKTCDPTNISNVKYNDYISTDSYVEYSASGFDIQEFRCQSGFYYNTETGNCDVNCPIGCQCLYTTKFCTSCDPGFYWNSDYTCSPYVSALQVTTLIFLVIALIFGVMIVVRATTGK